MNLKYARGQDILHRCPVPACGLSGGLRRRAAALQRIETDSRRIATEPVAGNGAPE